MSQWTHVAATIRFDSMRFLGMPMPDLGKTADFEADDAAWDACSVPCGSEGSLQHHLWTNPSRDDLAAYTATIWGDLRDYDDVDEVVAYLRRICEGQMIRQGIATIEVEYRPVVVAIWDQDAKDWMILPHSRASASGSDGQAPISTTEAGQVPGTST